MNGHPLDITFNLLQALTDPESEQLLIAALDVSDPRTRSRAVSCLMNRGCVQGQVELIRRFTSLPPEAVAAIEKSPHLLEPGVRHALFQGGAELQHTAIELIRLFDVPELIPLLLEVLERTDHPCQEQAATTLLLQVGRLYDGLQQRDEHHHRPARARTEQRRAIMKCLGRSAERFSRLSPPQQVIESILILGQPQDAAIRLIFGQTLPECRTSATELVQTSPHPGIMQFLLDSLSESHPAPVVLEALKTRSDPAFVAHLLRWLPSRFSEEQSRNLRQIDRIPWLEAENLELIPAALHEAIVRYLAATSIFAEPCDRARRWIMKHGNPDARLAVATQLPNVGSTAIEGIICDGLDSEDEQVQVWAVAQLRNPQISGGLQMLVERLDSESTAVRQAVRQELESFDLERVIAMFDRLETPACEAAGKLLLKVHPECIAQLEELLDSPVRSRRLRAAQAASALGLASRVVPSLMTMLDDSDGMVRRIGVEVLGSLPDGQGLRLVEPLRHDPSPRIRDAVEELLRGGQAVAAGPTPEQDSTTA